jgi:hypothetical protein
MRWPALAAVLLSACAGTNLAAHGDEDAERFAQLEPAWIALRADPVPAFRETMFGLRSSAPTGDLATRYFALARSESSRWSIGAWLRMGQIARAFDWVARREGPEQARLPICFGCYAVYGPPTVFEELALGDYQHAIALAARLGLEDDPFTREAIEAADAICMGCGAR